MAKRTFRCARCGRGFSMAAHLARHQSAVHGMGSRRRRGRPPGGARRGPGRPRKSGAPAAGGEAATRIVSEMSAYREHLVAQRESIEAQLSGIENAMSAMGTGAMIVPGRPGRPSGRPAGRRGRRGRGRPKGSGGRSGSLKPMVVQVLRQRGGAMTPQEIATAVVRAGYRTKAGNLTKAVSNALPDIREVKRVGRGQYST